jgi:hypothetical protein
MRLALKHLIVTRKEIYKLTSLNSLQLAIFTKFRKDCTVTGRRHSWSLRRLCQFEELPALYVTEPSLRTDHFDQDTNKLRTALPDLSSKQLNSRVRNGIVLPYELVSLDEVVYRVREVRV